MTEPDPALLQALKAVKHYKVRGLAGRHAPPVKAVDGVDLRVLAGRSVGIAGESGSGKSTLMRLLLAIDMPTAGCLQFEGRPMTSLDRHDWRRFRASVQAVFQDPGGSFDPRDRIGRIVTEPAWIALSLNRAQRKEEARQLLKSVGLPDGYASRYPHQLSGGERQRVAIARALSCDPAVVLLDEPVTSLDVSIRGHILNLLMEKAQSLGVTYVVISHDLTAIYYLTDHLYVMYRGQVVEEGPTVDVIDRPAHPYTRVLVAAANDPLSEPPGGDDIDARPPDRACPYLPRCEHAMAACASMPEPRVVHDSVVRCHLFPASTGGDDPSRSSAESASVLGRP